MLLLVACFGIQIRAKLSSHFANSNTWLCEHEYEAPGGRAVL
jgi:hypothetical protein